MTFKEAETKLIEMMEEKPFKAYDFDGKVTVKHQDGSKLYLENVVVIEDHKPWIYVVTEHLGYFLFHEEDLDSIKYEAY